MSTIIKKKIVLPKNITAEFAAELKECFDWQDRNSDGLVSKESLLILLRAAGQVWSLDEIEKICHELGTNDIDFQIYLDLVAHKFSLKADKQELINAFNILDRSGNGKVLVSDLKHILCSIGEKLTDESFQELLRISDVPDAVRLTYLNKSEFLKIFGKTSD
ncbi:EF hand family protein [Cryptosporidium andersoni]|uniref:EF hand family protein n=1 Tax=Cryptosporidium andersoni TaxID=117008 RepID=A0A1J4MSG2_9CRYT|nr:EF hand family protein [Cryptosporidium andersoni]